MKAVIDLKSKRWGITFLCLGVFNLFTIIAFMSLWPYFRASASNQVSGINYLAYFTYLSNLLAAVWLILTGISNIFKFEKLQKFLVSPKVFVAVVMYIFVVGLVFYGFLRWVNTPYPWSLWYARLIDFCNHGLFPLLMTLLFLFSKNEAKERIKQRHVLFWMIFPIAYVIFSLVRGSIDGFYAYPFFDLNWEVFQNIGLTSPFLFFPLLMLLSFGAFYAMGLLFKLIWNRLSGIVKVVEKPLVEELEEGVAHE